jgi:peptide/nickel transport system substrate-binding protein
VEGRSFQMTEEGGHVSRRQFLQRGGATVAGLGAMGLLGAACSSSSSSSSATTHSAGQPRRGGTLNLASIGGSSSDTLDAHNPLNIPDFPRVLALYSLLFTLDPNAQVRPALASELSSNKDASIWTLRLRPGVKTHDGKAFEAADVLYSFRRITNPKSPMPGAAFLAPLDLAAAQILDSRTLRLPCHTPYSVFPEALANDYCLMVPRGYDPKHPIGTGPFKFGSFTPGSESKFSRFDDYWMDGQPYADELIVTDYEDSTAQQNALLSGEANLADYLTQTSVSAVKAGGAAAVISHTGNYNPITMSVTQPPFDDARVRQAFRLMADRPQFLSSVFGGYGQVGNDVFSIYDPSYDHSLPQRNQDIAQAKSLLKAAGHENLALDIYTSNGISAAVIPEATLFAQQASAAGVKLTVQTITATEYWSKYYKKVPLSQDNWSYQPYLIQVASELLPTAPFNETHYDSGRYNKLYNSAMRAVDVNQRTSIIHEMQSMDYQTGSLVIPYFAPMFDGAGKKVHGVVPSRVGIPLDNYNTAAFWIE